MQTEERQFFESVIEKNFEVGKQLGLYEDEHARDRGLSRDRITETDILKVSNATLQVMPLIEDDLVLIIASVFYEIMPAFQESILAGR